jgi:hypothetical protein
LRFPKQLLRRSHTWRVSFIELQLFSSSCCRLLDLIYKIYHSLTLLVLLAIFFSFFLRACLGIATRRALRYRTAKGPLMLVGTASKPGRSCSTLIGDRVATQMRALCSTPCLYITICIVTGRIVGNIQVVAHTQITLCRMHLETPSRTIMEQTRLLNVWGF